MRHAGNFLDVIFRKSFARLVHAQFTAYVPGDNKNDMIGFGSLMQTEKRKCWFCVKL